MEQIRGIGFVRKKFYTSLTALLVVTSSIFLLNMLGVSSQAALPRDCNANSIINCGAVTGDELAQKYSQNATGDLPAIYNAYGITGQMIASTGTVAKMGEVHKDGRVTVNGETVATNATSIGRHNMAGSVPKVIAGKTYFDSPPSTSFLSESIVAFVYFTPDGQFKAAIITSCGNPLTAVPVPPKKPAATFKCVSLTADKISRNVFRFMARAEVTGDAIVTNYRYDFGDGKTQNSTQTSVEHTYAADGVYTAKLSVDIKVGNETKTVTAPSCQVVVNVEAAPAFKCDSLTVRTIKLEDRTYAFDLAFTVSGGASLKSVDYQFGDGQSRENVSPEEAKSVTHTYAKAGTFTTTATLHFAADDSGTIKDDDCQVTITTSPEMCPLNPTLPVGDARCAPCPIPGKEHLPKDSPLCVTPSVAELPKTGPMDLIGGGLGLGSLIAASSYWYASRRGLLTAFLER